MILIWNKVEFNYLSAMIQLILNINLDNLQHIVLINIISKINPAYSAVVILAAAPWGAQWWLRPIPIWRDPDCPATLHVIPASPSFVSRPLSSPILSTFAAELQLPLHHIPTPVYHMISTWYKSNRIHTHTSTQMKTQHTHAHPHTHTHLYCFESNSLIPTKQVYFIEVLLKVDVCFVISCISHHPKTFWKLSTFLIETNQLGTAFITRRRVVTLERYTFITGLQTIFLNSGFNWIKQQLSLPQKNSPSLWSKIIIAMVTIYHHTKISMWHMMMGQTQWWDGPHDGTDPMKGWTTWWDGSHDGTDHMMGRIPWRDGPHDGTTCYNAHTHFQAVSTAITKT